jgi:hypothetical protein
MQPDSKLYELLCSEIIIYNLYDDRCRHWQALVIYPSRAIDQSSAKVLPEPTS